MFMITPITSRVFMNGNSQAVRIPREYRLDAATVEVSRNAQGDLVIHPLPQSTENRGEALLQALAGFDDEFIDLLESEQQNQPTPQERHWP